MVLMVDKNKDVLDCYGDFYTGLNIKSAGFTDATEAYDFFIKFYKSFSLITTGLAFDDKHNGLWLARNIKKISPLPILLITADLPPDGFESDVFTSVLIKPINLNELTTLVSFWHSKS